METAQKTAERSAILLRSVRKIAVMILAVIGFLWLVGGPILRLLLSPLYLTETVSRQHSSDKAYLAETEVTRGGFGTVWITRVFVTPSKGGQWLIYETRDSDFTPPLRWQGKNTLILGLPCGRFGHVSNPDDWESIEPRPHRLRVRPEFPEECH